MWDRSLPHLAPHFLHWQDWNSLRFQTRLFPQPYLGWRDKAWDLLQACNPCVATLSVSQMPLATTLSLVISTIRVKRQMVGAQQRKLRLVGGALGHHSSSHMTSFENNWHSHEAKIKSGCEATHKTLHSAGLQPCIQWPHQCQYSCLANATFSMVHAKYLWDDTTNPGVEL